MAGAARHAARGRRREEQCTRCSKRAPFDSHSHLFSSAVVCCGASLSKTLSAAYEDATPLSDWRRLPLGPMRLGGIRCSHSGSRSTTPLRSSLVAPRLFPFCPLYCAYLLPAVAPVRLSPPLPRRRPTALSSAIRSPILASTASSPDISLLLCVSPGTRFPSRRLDSPTLLPASLSP
ncbi:hypothetical protein P154DRAFT_266338 [Amniculicola lignicola CBS 123094]|uniref:Uncharacterized protein n=1 Tax=Amniculicola lignicola CBS 123094 TaxID=1392246 RepID=A0A6A5W7Y4_9PLEO|nr:hypothetical protein P154DRAFT_266338 [Amniculicola lignicola CBS 123094]